MTEPGTEGGRPLKRAWTWLGLGLLLVFAVWWRGHTFGPTIEKRTGWALWPEMHGPSEPLDCDEAAYGYIGRRLADGAVMYRDLTENKPPGGYWLFALAVKLGGANELTIRVIPVPMILLTVLLIFWIGRRVSGPAAGLIGGFVFVLLCTDPYLHGNGANLEHAMNLFAVASLAAMLASWKGRRGWLVVAGMLVGCSTLVKQVGAMAGPLYALAAWYREDRSTQQRPFRAYLLDLLALAAGFLVVWVVAVLVLVGQGAGPDAWHDIVRLGSAIASAPASANQPPFLIRWVTGNADANDGRLPWPFGKLDDWIVWWGQGTYPAWIMAIPGLLILPLKSPRGQRVLVALWTLLAWVEVALPGMFWAHYYLLPTPGVGLVFGVGMAECASWMTRRFRERRFLSALAGSVLSVGFLTAAVALVAIQVRTYLLVPPEGLTRYKSGLQWVADRQIGQALAPRAAVWDHPTLYVWGWQSPLYFYSGMDCPTRHFFPNDWILGQVGKRNPLVDRFLAETMHDLRANPPNLIFLGTRPFPELGNFVQERYVPSRLLEEGPFPLLWVRREDAETFNRGIPR